MTSRSLRRFILSVLLLAAINPLRSEQPPLRSHREFKIGVLASLTGSRNSLGQDTVAALQIATDPLDAEATANQGGYRFHLFVRDTQQAPVTALAAIKYPDRRWLQIMIGTKPRAEAVHIKP